MTTHPSVSQARHAARVRKVVEEVMAQRAGGGTLTDAQIIAANPGLMPDLASELALLAVLERAQPAALTRIGSSASGSLRDGAIPIAPDAFEGYQVVGEVHRGGQGVVYEATQKSTGRRVAVKVMREGLFGAAAGGRDSARFEREVRILGQLDHPGVVGILASGVHAGHFYYVMDYISGLPLDEHARGRPLRERLQVFVKVCEAVSAPHLRGIIHRDLKPANILVDERGQPHILDFGLARITAEWRADPRMTQTGQFVGSLPWSSPEQAAGNPDRIDIRTDVYSLGVLLYQALSGHFPYRVEGGPRDVLDQILTASPARLRSFARGIDDDLEAIVLKCLSKERERRYQSAGELADDLRRLLDRRPVLARAPGIGYQVRSFLRRHAALAAGTAAVGATLIVGLIGTTVGLIEASAGRRSAETARDVARSAEAVAKARLEESLRQTYVASISAADSALRAGDSAGASTRLKAAPASLRDWEWDYLAGRTDQSVEVLSVPPVFSAEVAPDGESFATLSRDGTVRLLDARTRAVRWETSVSAQAMAPDEQRVACFSRDGTLLATAHGSRVFVWRIGEPRPIADLMFPDASWGFITAAIDPENRTIVVNGRQRRMAIWDLRTGDKVREMPIGRSYSGVDFSADGRTFAVATSDGPMLLDGHTGVTVLEPAGAAVVDANIWPVRISPDGALLAIAQGSDIAIHSLPGGARRAVLRGHSQNVTALAFSPDGRRLASAGWDRAVRVWDLESSSPLASLLGHTGAINAIGFLNNGGLLTSAADGTIRRWEPHAAAAEPRSIMVASVVFGLTFAEGGRLFAFTSGKLRLLNTRSSLTEQLPETVHPWLDGALRGTLSPDGRRVAVVGAEGTTSVWDVDASRRLWSASSPAAPATYFAFAPGARVLATAANDRTIRLWDAATGAPSHVLACDNESARPMVFAPGGDLIASVNGAGVRLWDCRTGAVVGSLDDPARSTSHIAAVAFSPIGGLIATGDYEGSVTIWDAATRRPLRTIAGMQPTVWSLAFNPSGTRLAAGSQDRTVRILDPRTGEELLALRAHTGSVMSLAWTPDGRTLASGSYDGTIRLWFPGQRAGAP